MIKEDESLSLRSTSDITVRKKL